MNTRLLPYLLLRLGVAFAFIYPALDAYLDPYSWIGYFPKFMHGIVPDMVLLHSFGLVEIGIGAWLLYGKRIFLPACLAALLLLVIVFFNLRDFQIVFRDVAIAAAALALALMALGESTRLFQTQDKQS